MRRYKKILMGALVIPFVLVGCSQEEGEVEQANAEHLKAFEGNLGHVHGLGYTGEKDIAFASHSGIKLYQDGNWMEAIHHANDYMGFQAVDEGFFTSGHPGAGSDLPNPLGLQKGTLESEDMESLAFEGESDFHVLGVGYQNKDIYLFNERPNSELEQGFYRSSNEGQTWESIQGDGVDGGIFQIAVHPSDGEKVSVATDTGVFFSEDAGNTFERISESGQGSGLFFTEDDLYYSLYKGAPSMVAYQWEEGSKEDISLPAMEEDSVMYLAKHPDAEDSMTVFTFSGHGYVTEDDGENWELIIEEGEVQ